MLDQLFSSYEALSKNAKLYLKDQIGPASLTAKEAKEVLGFSASHFTQNLDDCFLEVEEAMVDRLQQE